MKRIAGFLRGINVGGHHKVPMVELREKLLSLGYLNVKTVLNSGNFVFDSTCENLAELQNKIEVFLSASFGFHIPTILKSQEEMHELLTLDPFRDVVLHNELRLYVTFLQNEHNNTLVLPYTSQDSSFTILSLKNKIVCSVLDLSSTKTPKGMEDLEKIFGKQITTRNWNTIKKILKLGD